MGKATPVGANRGRLLESPLIDVPVLITAHPSGVLRERDRTARRAALAALADDLSLAVR
jgi:uracil-DNA glycosylase